MRQAVVLFLAALAVRLAVLWIVPFDGLYGQDPYAYFDYARQAQQALRGEQLAGRFYWPLGYPILIAIGFLAAGVGPWAAQGVSLITGSLLAPLTYLAVREACLLHGATRRWRPAAMTAGAVVALSGQVIQSSLVIMADGPALFWATLSVWAVLRFARLGRAHWLAFALPALAMAVITRWIMGLLVVPWTAYLTLLAVRRRGPDRAPLLRGGVAGALAALAILLPQLRVSLDNPASLVQHAWLEQWNPAHAVARTFDNPDGHFEYTLPVGLFYLQPLFHPFYLVPLLTPLALLGAWHLRRRAILILLLGWPAAIYGFLGGLPYQNFRFPMAFFTPIAAFAGFGVSLLADQRPNLARMVTAVSLGGMFVFTVRGLLVDPGSVLNVKRRDLAVADWLEQRVPLGASVLTHGVTLTLQHYSPVHAVELYEEDPRSLAARACQAEALYLLLDVENVAQQWRGLPPETNYRWLREGPGLVALDRMGAYTLFRVRAACSDSAPAARREVAGTV